MSKTAIIIDNKKLNKIKKMMQNESYIQKAIEKIALTLTDGLISN